MSEYTQIHLSARPEAGEVPGPRLFEVRKQTIPAILDGQILIKQTHMSLDPAMLGWMSADTESYIPPVELGDVMRASGLGEVVESRHPDFAVGERVNGLLGWTEYAVSDGQNLNKLPPDLDAEAALAVFALPGMTATQGLLNVGKPKAGETLVVSGAAGSVGSIVGQLGKAEGLRVIGVVGSDEKARWIVDELGFDGAINYKTDNIPARLVELTPDRIDVYFENTGGPIQHHVMERMNAHGRIVVCGLIADYTSEEPSPGPSWLQVIKKRLTIQGFTMPDHWHEIPALQAQLTPYVMQGKIKYRTHIIEGLENAMDALALLFNGGNKGKLIVKL
ncbi:NADP-dependent oxidoreductase [Granulosicoccaceae sp. 1_MG-2023]|nr:NADP-dependent oxidoreductase [Granulosicoccaceae sp. 1_MG-2023]